ncbi:hypothetical protein N7448_008555 [Penicillium atrosanguineum]|uniref:Kinase n=1 Tax=Penicillium atrosanguineum TaxID=1132637 RepID=A0A9W9GRU2_9EURO|nr:Transcription initiation factor TFIID 23-30kDa subunit [Penicillium atrosanguineum]KAJ5127776.1 hypothetical protein N7448_008555 [Penicillium atrosanguineum]KAJ5147985.1 hypothetical protein N7526_001337 [Penicillium atrosanguineum]KAJ5313545.1 Transcription initiation factor TFIID 23-30kDa subunit [Penicillium atrosanguineum]KAJ5330719.1 hypothetical protein N7476_000502 [Penicillium atrosanguineum]
MPPSRSESLKTPQLGSDDLVPFDHVAAGHDGVRCTLSGALIAKPCVQQEVDFYEASALHPGFQEFMPLFIGSLSSADQQQPLAISATQGSGAVFLPPAGDALTTPNTTAVSSQQTPVEPSTVTSSGTDQPWVPSGGKKLETGLSIVLENIAAGFHRPNVLDVKLGARLWADDAPPAKRHKLDAVSKETTSGSLGYRIAGMKVWSGTDGEIDEGSRTNPYATKYEGAEGARGEVIEKDGYRRYDKWYGRSFSADTVKEGFETFLAGAKAGSVDRSKMVARRITEELQNVQRVLESEESRMYSSSVLVIYEGDPEAMAVALEEEKKIPEQRDPEDEDSDEEVNFEFTEEPLELVDVRLPDGIPKKAINISFDPQTVQVPLELDDDEDEDETPKVHDLRIIDFAHATWTPGEGPDENVLMGVRSLVKIFNELAE